MKRAFTVLVTFVLVLSLCACGGKKSVDNKIPDVFGINFNDAIAILEADGYEVDAIETKVDSISDKLLYPLEKVDKGTVFKIDDYILDNLGNLNKNYDVFYDGELASEDKSVVIYYSEEDYVLEKDENEIVETEETTKYVPENNETTTDTQTVETEVPVDNNSIDPEFKAAMDSYESFMNEYVDFMKKYSENPSDFTLLADYATYMSKYSEFVKDFEKWEDEDMNDAETAYYIDVQTRVNNKLLEVTY